MNDDKEPYRHSLGDGPVFPPSFTATLELGDSILTPAKCSQCGIELGRYIVYKVRYFVKKGEVMQGVEAHSKCWFCQTVNKIKWEAPLVD